MRSRRSTFPWSWLFPARRPPSPWSFTPAAEIRASSNGGFWQQHAGVNYISHSFARGTARKRGSPSVVKWVPAWISKPPAKSSPHCAARRRKPEISAWVGLRVTGLEKPPAITRAARGRAAAGSGDAASAGLRRPASRLDTKRPGLRFRSTESLSARSNRPIAGYATVQLRVSGRRGDDR